MADTFNKKALQQKKAKKRNKISSKEKRKERPIMTKGKVWKK